MQVEHLLEVIPTRNIMVVGDVMLDEYLWGSVRGISPEAPVPVVEIRHQTYALGGAGNVATNLSSLGCNVWVTGVVGADMQAAKMFELFSQSPRTSTHLFPCPDRPTTTKTRIVAHSQQMLRTDREERHAIPAEAEANILNCVQERLATLSACVLSDYGKGVLTDSLIRAIIGLCQSANVPVIVDPKGHRYFRYHGATVVTPNANEANIAAENSDEHLPVDAVAERLLGEIGNGALLITRGPHGMSLYTHNAQPVHIPAQARTIYDVTGAGDTVVAVLALLLSTDLDMISAAKIANYAAGIVVGKVGTASITLEELATAFQDD